MRPLRDKNAISLNVQHISAASRHSRMVSVGNPSPRERSEPHASRSPDGGASLALIHPTVLAGPAAATNAGPTCRAGNLFTQLCSASFRFPAGGVHKRSQAVGLPFSRGRGRTDEHVALNRAQLALVRCHGRQVDAYALRRHGRVNDACKRRIEKAGLHEAQVATAASASDACPLRVHTEESDT